ncbi:MAG: signal peptidase II [Alphaproteobacteria bacterium]|nr:signal peptidase II [Alphaproteobacteria bacterium]
MKKKTKVKKTTLKVNGDTKYHPLNFFCSWSIFGMALAGGVYILDQVSKWIVLKHLMTSPHTFSVTSFLNIILAWNKGISFGLLSNNNPYSVWILVVIAIGFAALLILWILQAETKIMSLAFGLVLGGALGNVTDRIRFGAVADFLDFHVYGFHWYTFNIADAAIVLGVALILLEYLKEIWSENKR